MDLEKPAESDVQDEGSSVADLEKLRDQLLSSNPSVRRQAAFNLSWMQEDGLEILKDILYGDYPKSSKTAVAYGLRKMRGRMKKMARIVFEEGLEHQDTDTRDVCRGAVSMAIEAEQRSPAEKGGNRKTPIQEIKRKRKPKKRVSHEHVRSHHKRGFNRR